MRRPSIASSAGTTNRRNAISAETGLPGSAKTSVPSSLTANVVGRPGLSLTPAKTSRKPSRASAGRTWSCGPTDTPPVVMSMSTSRSAARITATVASRSSPTRTRVTSSPPARCTAPPSAGPFESRMPPGGKRLAGVGQLVTGAHERDPRPPHDAGARDVQRREHAHLGRAEQRAGVDDERARPDVLAGRAQVQALADRSRRRRSRRRRRHDLLLGDRVGALRHRRAGRDAHRRAGPHRRRPPRCRPSPPRSAPGAPTRPAVSAATIA